MADTPEGGYIDTVQPTMQRTIRWLQSLGMEPTDSGDGVTNVEADMECALDFPHVFIPFDQLGQGKVAADLIWSQIRTIAEDNTDISVEAGYSPEDGLTTVALYGITDANLPEGLGT